MHSTYTRYSTTIEGLLRAFARSALGEHYIVRGGVALRGLLGDYPRPVEDFDLMFLGDFDVPRIASDMETLVAEAAALELEWVQSEVIWEETDFPGLRLHLNSPRESGFQLDIGFGDRLVDGPISVELLDGVEVTIPRPETFYGWKVHGLWERGRGRWRAKDLHDVDLLVRRCALDPVRTRQTLREAFESRGDSLELIQVLLDGEWGGSRGSRRKWRRFREQHPTDRDIAPLEEVLKRVAEALGEFLA